MGAAASRPLLRQCCGAQPLDEDLCAAGALYPLRANIDKRKLRALILEGKLAPCHAGKEINEQGEDGSNLNGGEDDEANTAEQLLDECPICMLGYPALNRSTCCRQGICTECFLQLGPTRAPRTGDGPARCPFCATADYSVQFVGRKSAAEREAEARERQDVARALARARAGSVVGNRSTRAEEEGAQRASPEARSAPDDTVAAPQPAAPPETDGARRQQPPHAQTGTLASSSASGPAMRSQSKAAMLAWKARRLITKVKAWASSPAPVRAAGDALVTRYSLRRAAAQEALARARERESERERATAAALRAQRARTADAPDGEARTRTAWGARPAEPALDDGTDGEATDGRGAQHEQVVELGGLEREHVAGVQRELRDVLPARLFDDALRGGAALADFENAMLEHAILASLAGAPSASTAAASAPTGETSSADDVRAGVEAAGPGHDEVDENGATAVQLDSDSNNEGDGGGDQEDAHEIRVTHDEDGAASREIESIREGAQDAEGDDKDREDDTEEEEPLAPLCEGDESEGHIEKRFACTSGGDERSATGIADATASVEGGGSMEVENMSSADVVEDVDDVASVASTQVGAGTKSWEMPGSLAGSIGTLGASAAAAVKSSIGAAANALVTAA